MRQGVLELREFYATPLGRVARVMVSRKITEAWGNARGLDLLALGYASWAPGQLDEEIQQNAWLSAPASLDLVFDGEHETKWRRALASLKVDPLLLSAAAGHA